MAIDLGDLFETVYALARRTNAPLHQVIRRLVAIGAAELRRRESSTDAENDEEATLRGEPSPCEPHPEQGTN